jgi:hypothetical protein
LASNITHLFVDIVVPCTRGKGLQLFFDISGKLSVEMRGADFLRDVAVARIARRDPANTSGILVAPKQGELIASRHRSHPANIRLTRLCSTQSSSNRHSDRGAAMRTDSNPLSVGEQLIAPNDTIIAGPAVCARSNCFFFPVRSGKIICGAALGSVRHG